MKSAKPKDIDDYIGRFPVDIQNRLKQIQTTIIKTVPGADESISYGIPTVNLNGTYLLLGRFN